MKNFLIVLLALFSVNAFASQCWLDDDQQQVVNRAYELGEPDGLGWTMAAIVIKESGAGKMLVNDRSKDYGAFGINLKTAKRRTEHLVGAKMNQREVRGLRKQLIQDFEMGAMYAKMELDFWIKSYGENWPRVWEAYNAGYKRTSVSKAYARDITNTIQKLKRSNCVKEA